MDTLKINHSSELMQNFLPADSIDPQNDFTAVQTTEGMALFFSIGTDHRFYLTEQNTTSTTGWKQQDLSHPLDAKHPGQTIKTKQFTVAQNPVNNNIHIAISVEVNNQEYIYFSSANKAEAHSINSESINWNALSFDDPGKENVHLKIEQILLGESDQDAYLFVDINAQSFGEQRQHIYHYLITPNKNINGHTFPNIWNPINISGMTDQVTQTIIGRKNHQKVDGAYFLGKSSNTSKLSYAPVYDRYSTGSAPLPITELCLPDGKQATAMDVCLQKDNIHTDLYVICDKSLYYFPFDHQKDRDEAKLCFEHSLFEGVNHLSVHRSGEDIVVWGLNRNKEVFYTRCNETKLEDSKSWSYPLPLAKTVEQASPFINLIDGGNTIFTHEGQNDIVMRTQNPETTLWKRHEIHLPSLNNKVDQTKTFSSYTTKIQTCDKDNSPVQNASLKISTKGRCPVYINNIYHVLDTHPTDIKTDVSGTLTIIEAVEGLNGHIFTVDAEGLENTLIIDPAQAPMDKLKNLDTPEKLEGAQVKYSQVNAKSKPLIDSGVPKTQIQKLSKALNHLQTIKPTNISTNQPTQRHTPATTLISGEQSYKLVYSNAGGASSIDLSAADEINVYAGDILHWLDDMVDKAWTFVVDTVNGVTNFVVHIAGKAYRFIVDCIEKARECCAALFKLVKTGIEHLLDYLKFLFDWKSFIRSKDVLVKLININLDNIVEGAEQVEQEIDQKITEFQNKFDQWANLKPSDLSNINDRRIHTQSGQESNHHLSAPGTLLHHHASHNSHQIISQTPTESGGSLAADAYSLFNTYDQHGSNMSSCLAHLQASANTSNNFEDFLKKIAATGVNCALDGVKSLLGYVFSLFKKGTESIKKWLNAKITFPVITDILKHFGIDFEFSMLELISMVIAVPGTILYKVIFNKDPIPESPNFENQLSQAKTVEDIKLIFEHQNHRLNENTQIALAQQTNLQEHSLSAYYLWLRSFQSAASYLQAFFIGLQMAVKETGYDPSDNSYASAMSYTVAATEFLCKLDNPIEKLESPWEEFESILSVASVANLVIFRLFPMLLSFRQNSYVKQGLKSGRGFTIYRTIAGIIGFLKLLLMIAKIIKTSRGQCSYKTSAILWEVSDACTDLSKVIIMIYWWMPEGTEEAKPYVAAGVFLSLAGAGVCSTVAIVEQKDKF